MTSLKECVKLLLDHGADIKLKSRMDELAEDCISSKLTKKDKAYIAELFAQAREAN